MGAVRATPIIHDLKSSVQDDFTDARLQTFQTFFSPENPAPVEVEFPRELHELRPPCIRVSQRPALAHDCV